MTKISVWRVALVVIATFVLFVSLLCIILDGYYFKEERKYEKQITITTEQFEQIADDDEIHYWRIPDKGPCTVADEMTCKVGKKMTFAYRNNLPEMKGNCEGQAMLCSAVINKAFKERGFKNCYAEPVIGQVYFYNINMNKILVKIVPKKYKNFVVNHCVVKVHYNDGEERYYDPSIGDGYTNINKK